VNSGLEGVSVKLEALSQQLGKRAPVPEQIAASIRNMIVAGDLQPGERIVESRIARERKLWRSNWPSRPLPTKKSGSC
jgi:hypothetical protein